MVGYEPTFLRGLEQIHRAHALRLGQLVGRRLSASAVVVHAQAGDWIAEYPVVLSFGAEQVEIKHSRFDDLSISWNGIDTAAPIPGFVIDDFPAMSGILFEEPTPVYIHDPVWKFDDERLTPFHGQLLREVALMQWRGDDAAFGMVSVEFVFTGGRLRIVNGLDENAIEIGETTRPHYHRVVV